MKSNKTKLYEKYQNYFDVCSAQGFFHQQLLSDHLKFTKTVVTTNSDIKDVTGYNLKTIS